MQIAARVFNERFLPFIDCTSHTQIFYGGAGSGKSVFLSDRDIIRVVNEPRNILLVRNVQNTIRGSVFEEAKKSIRKFKLLPVFDVRETDLTITYKPRGNVMIFRGLDDVERLKSITVPIGTITDLRIEEATEIHEADYDQLDIRLRGLCEVQKCRTLSFNPIYRTHWIAKRFFNCENIKFKYTPKLLILHSTHHDNKFLTKDDHDNIEGKKGYMHDVYAKGEWGVLGDVIFTNWRTDDLSGMYDKIDNKRFGLDFGYSSDPAALVCVGRHNGKIYIFKEFVQKKLTNPMLAAAIKPIVGNNIVLCDSAEPKSIVELQMCGINAYPVQKRRVANLTSSQSSYLLFGIQWLQQHEIIVDRSCQTIQNEMSIYQWQKDKHGEDLPVPVDANNHTIDALRYAFDNDMLAGTVGLTV